MWIQIGITIAVLLLIATVANTSVGRVLRVQFVECQELLGIVGLKAILKVVVSTLQILSHLTDNLSLQLPALDALVSWFSFDIGVGFNLGCWTNGGYVWSLTFNVGLVVVIGATVGVMYCFRLQRLLSSKELFDQFDPSGKGEIDKETAQEIMLQVSPSAAPDEVDALFERADVDKNGTLSHDEFLNAAKEGAISFDLQVSAKKHAKDSIRDKASGRLFLLVYLLYPTVTNKVRLQSVCSAVYVLYSLLMMS
jgi:hypothetical protein